MSSASSRARTAKPESPARVHRQTWSYVGRRTIQEFLRDGCVDIAGSLTFFAVLRRAVNRLRELRGRGASG